MMTQTDLFDPAEKTDADQAGEHEHEPETLLAAANPIAVPCGFMDRHNNRCQRLGNWPVMAEGKQMVCRGRPMVHCDPACFRADAVPVRYGAEDEDMVWDDRVNIDDHDQ